MNANTKNPREAALLILQQIFLKGAYANLALAQGLRGAPLSALDRKLATELVYGTVNRSLPVTQMGTSLVGEAPADAGDTDGA